MAGGFGYFFGGVAQGLQSGMSWKEKKLELKEKKRAREEAEKLKEQVASEMKEFTAKIDEAIKEGWTEQEIREINVAYLAASKDLRSHFEGVMKYINEGHIAEAKSQMDFINDFTNNLMGSLDSLQSKDVAGFYDSVTSMLTDESALQVVEVHKSIAENMAKSREEQEAKQMEQATAARNQLFKQGTYYNSLQEAQAATAGQENIDIKFDKNMNAFYAEQKGMTPRDYKDEGVTGSAGTSGVTGNTSIIDETVGEKVESGGLGGIIKKGWNYLFGGGETPSVTGTTSNPRAQKANPNVTGSLQAEKGYSIGEIIEVNGTKFRFVGDDRWEPI